MPVQRFKGAVPQEDDFDIAMPTLPTLQRAEVSMAVRSVSNRISESQEGEQSQGGDKEPFEQNSVATLGQYPTTFEISNAAPTLVRQTEQQSGIMTQNSDESSLSHVLPLPPSLARGSKIVSSRTQSVSEGTSLTAQREDGPSDALVSSPQSPLQLPPELPLSRCLGLPVWMQRMQQDGDASGTRGEGGTNAPQGAADSGTGVPTESRDDDTRQQVPSPLPIQPVGYVNLESALEGSGVQTQQLVPPTLIGHRVNYLAPPMLTQDRDSNGNDEIGRNEDGDLSVVSMSSFSVTGPLLFAPGEGRSVIAEAISVPGLPANSNYRQAQVPETIPVTQFGGTVSFITMPSDSQMESFSAIPHGKFGCSLCWPLEKVNQAYSEINYVYYLRILSFPDISCIFNPIRPHTDWSTIAKGRSDGEHSYHFAFDEGSLSREHY